MKSDSENPQAEMTFLGHLEELRWHLVRSVSVLMVFAIALFAFKEFVFDEVLLAPKNPDFFTYRQLCKIALWMNLGEDFCIREIPFVLISTDLSAQFTTHMWVAFIGGFVCAFPYIIWELWRFIKPALHKQERRYARGIVFYTSFLFLCGVLFGYYVISPMTINFLGSYQVSESVKNTITLSSFISTITTMTIISGIIFELPIIVYFLSKIGILNPTFMRTYRRHAVVIILILAAVITPTSDATTLMLVAIPLYVLYELSIFVSAYVVKKQQV
ncbi:MAG: twin-arginine translocase subunit TatC [Bacteroidetes bacterium]|nr:MAG: twin-arginine translocase subunit TatC [Bacteroidota bacterium]REK06681.1 MAG: twin-arginine translocase subunit TatC [Bacteroidota bacterium]REK33446.1 MAG: twin-arginine translocase subunit TatC [Bacteroidota bacterium]REK49839.1 MAG: twin-arginine translocase subunit TatC [Bacteroidota bacterium]